MNKKVNLLIFQKSFAKINLELSYRRGWPVECCLVCAAHSVLPCMQSMPINQQRNHQKTGGRITNIWAITTMARKQDVLYYIIAVFENRLKINFSLSSMRRGYLVYKRVCSTCHSMKLLKYMDLIDQTHTREEAEKEAAEISVSEM